MTRILLLGGASEIGLAIVAELVREATLRGDRGEERWLRCEPKGRASKPHASVEVVLAGRPGSAHRAGAIAQIEATGARVSWLDFDAADPSSHPDLIETAFAEPVDVAIVAFGLLGERGTWRDHAATMRLVQTNYTGALSVGVLLAQQFSAQGYGRLIALSSVAGERVRRSNLVYGSTKAGMDGFYLQLGVELAAEAIQVLVVRPGTVRGRMAAARGRVPLSSSPEQVARRTVAALRAGRAMVRIPAIFGPISAIFRNLPAWLANRMPF